MITVKDIQSVLFGVCEWRVYTSEGAFDKSIITHAYEMRFENGYADYEVTKIDSRAFTIGLFGRRPKQDNYYTTLALC